MLLVGIYRFKWSKTNAVKNSNIRCTMNRVIKKITILGIIAIVLVLIVSRNNKSLKSPNPE